jgi:hypothetical protein
VRCFTDFGKDLRANVGQRDRHILVLIRAICSVIPTERDVESAFVLEASRPNCILSELD